VNSAVREGFERYCAEQILRMVIERADKLRLWVRGSRRDSLRHSRRMVIYLTRLYAQGESPTLAL
jgi:hypothetical protein